MWPMERGLDSRSGERLVMPNVVRLVGRLTVIEQYFKHCYEDGFDPLEDQRSTEFCKSEKPLKRGPFKA